ncbi:hypothetical protein HCU01_01330 [Halomonas cupida]|uniref:Uncharacterized protein n=1 Tax=Halomonas cupida TaxID=44933 RepID=A0A1M7B0Y1_9GAMM|nr:hypothetical protein [Halomonas cupida]GEN22184.1 hypothetical protein HCU01_01330 [Halomonas cupida]SHL48601.1 hypothetical protein SAMN05660971_00716 [Halomonas cupida]
MKRTPQGWPKGAEYWSLEQIEEFLTSEQEKPFQYGMEKFTRLVNDCATDRKFVEDSPGLLELLLLVRDGMVDGATEHWTLDDYLEWLISARNKRVSKQRHAETQDFKRDVYQYYREHQGTFRSKRAAAAAIHEAKLVPVEERTIYGWLRELD